MEITDDHFTWERKHEKKQAEKASNQTMTFKEHIAPPIILKTTKDPQVSSITTQINVEGYNLL